MKYLCSYQFSRSSYGKQIVWTYGWLNVFNAEFLFFTDILDDFKCWMQKLFSCETMTNVYLTN